MEALLRVSAAALCALTAVLLLRRTNPELSSSLSIAATAVIVIAAFGMMRGFGELKKTLQTVFGADEVLIVPLVKCVAAAVITRLTADQCRDASQAATASAVEFAGTVCAFGIVLPLILTALKTIGGYL
ncbi:MAG: stage III sporulation AC/AD family protein [Oscillospiraceae bacterium]|nr:stage III sporulation AC/AD family protein [Oscillospiraceae bacterium]